MVGAYKEKERGRKAEKDEKSKQQTCRCVRSSHAHWTLLHSLTYFCARAMETIVGRRSTRIIFVAYSIKDPAPDIGFLAEIGCFFHML